MQKIKKFCHNPFKKPDNYVATWQEVTLSRLIQIGNDVERPPERSTLFMISSGKADPIETKQIRENKDTPLPTVGIPPLSMVERLALRLGGAISCGMLQPQGYGPTEFFLKHCSKHGIITTHRQGYLGILRCGQCCEERGRISPIQRARICR